MIHPKYRADVDGLRAVAVFSVVSFHAFPDKMPSGFIGVDIFFVISGFLISSILFSNFDQNRFSLIEFYSRRINRIYPALLIVMFGSLITGWFVLYENEYKQLAKHISGGVGFVSNIVLWKQSGYFDTASDLKPLLHLWSLAVEEQFYILWPFILSFILKKTYSHLSFLFFVLIASFVVNIYLSFYYPEAAFFLPIPRFWELAIGGILAYIHAYKSKYAFCFSNLKSVVGFLMLAAGFLYIDRGLSFPGYWVLLPVFGAFFIISAGDNAVLNKMLLSNRIMVNFGLISYPLYLWHWPLLSYSRIVYDQPSVELRFGLVIISFILAYLTFNLIEKRVRRSKSRYKALILLLLSAMILILAVFVISNKGFVDRDVNKPFIKYGKKIIKKCSHPMVHAYQS